MATPTDQSNVSNDVAIFRLPDELLMNILSYITRISKKMELEQVSKRFRFVGSQSPSWRGIHKLELMMKCMEFGDMMELKGNCGNDFCCLNNHLIDVKKWPAAVQLLIDRTQIQQIVLHCGECTTVFNDNPTIFPDIMEIMKKNVDKMKIESLEVHYASNLLAMIDLDPFPFNAMKTFLLDSLQMSVPYLKELLLKISDDYKIPGNPQPLDQIWPIVNECQNLQSIAFDGRILCVDLSALAGKPLTKVVICVGKNMFNTVNDVAQVINGASGDGVHQLSVIEGCSDIFSLLSPFHLHVDLRVLCDHLNDKARDKLKVITITVPASYLHLALQNLPFIPSMFPSFEKLNILTERNVDEDYGTNELLANIVSFMTLCHTDSFMRKIMVEMLSVSDVDAFKTRLTTECEAAEIDVEFGKIEADDLDLQSVLLSKGNASIITKVYKKLDDDEDE